MPKPFTPTAEQRKIVERMKANGLTNEEIAYYLNVDRNTLHKYFSNEIAMGLPMAIHKMGERLWNVAMGPPAQDGDQAPPATPAQVTAIIFWLKTRGKWSTTVDVNMTHKTEAIEKLEKHIEQLPFEQLQEIRQLLTIDNETGEEVEE